MLKNQGQRTLLRTTNSIRTSTLSQKKTALNAHRSIHVSVAVSHKARRQVDQQRNNNSQHSIGGIFEPFLETPTTTNKQTKTKSKNEIIEKLPTKIKVEDVLPEDSELEMLLENKQIALPIEKQKAVVNYILEKLKSDKPIDSKELVQISDNQVSQLVELANIVIRTSRYGAPIVYELYRAAMDHGDDRGAYSFATMAYKGYGVPKDEDTGIKVLSELARKGHPHAQMNLASNLMRTQPNQISAAIKLYELAGKGGIDNAFMELGRMYRIGYGVHQDHEKAMDYFQRGAQKGNAQCMFMLGVYHSSNQIGKEDQKKAFKYFQKAAMRGSPEAQYNVGFRFLKGYGVDANAFNAVEFFKMAALQGFQLAQANLASMYMQGHGIKQDLNEARYWYQKVVDKGGNIGKEAQKALDELNGKKSNGSRCSIM